MARVKRLVLMTAVAAVLATVSCRAEAKQPAVMGGFGHAFIGGMFGRLGHLEAELQQPEALGEGLSLSPAVMPIGGGGKALFAGGILIGGGGMGFVFFPSNAESGAGVTISGGGGGLHVGWSVFNQDYWLLYPYIGVGGFGISVEIDNSTSRDLRIGDDVIAPGGTREYQSGFWTTEFGLGVQRLLFIGDSDAGGGGFIVGAEGGLITSLVKGDWQDGDQHDITGLADLGFTGGYLRLTVGGGGFFFE